MSGRSAVGAVAGAVLLAVSSMLGFAAPARAATVEVDSIGELQEAFGDARGHDNVVRLTGDMATPGRGTTVALPDDTSVLLDLNGHRLTLIGDIDVSGIRVPFTSVLIIDDTSTTGGGELTARGGPLAAGIGGGIGESVGTIIVNGGAVHAEATEYAAAGIGGGQYGAGGTLTVNGGTVTAVGTDSGAGIGGGQFGNGGTVLVNGGTVNAWGGSGGAAIGGGAGAPGGTLTVNGGTVNAWGGSGGAAIGGGFAGAGGSVSIGAEGHVVVAASEARAVGGGFQSGDFGRLSNGGVLTVRDGSTLEIPSGVTVSNTGTLRGPGTLAGAGTIHNSGAITNSATVDTSAGLTITGNNYLLAFEANAGTGAPAEMRVYALTLAAAETDVPATRPVREGHEFSGWYLDPAASGPPVTATTVLGDGVPGTVTLYAGWVMRTYVVEFDAGGGVSVADQEVEHGGLVAVPRPPVREGFDFLGWYTAEDGGRLWDFASDTVTAETVLHARWAETAVPVPEDPKPAAPPAPGPPPAAPERLPDTGGAAWPTPAVGAALALVVVGLGLIRHRHQTGV